MKRSFAFFITLLLMFALALPFSADTDVARLDDRSELLTSAEQASLSSLLNEVSARRGVDILILTADGTDGKDASDFIADYYAEKGFAADGVVLLIETTESYWFIAPQGRCADVFTETVNDSIGYTITSESFNYGHYYDGFKRFAEFCDEFLAHGSGQKVPRLSDAADLLTSQEETELLALLDEVSTRQKTDVTILTVYSTGNKTAVEFADDYYDGNGFADDGILLLIRMSDRYLYMSTKGDGIRTFTDAGIDYIADKIAENYLADNDYYGGFKSFVSLCDRFIEKAHNGKPYDVGNMPFEPLGLVWIGIAVIGGLIVGAAVTGSMKSKLKTVRSQPAANAYVRANSLNLTASGETFLYHQVSRTRRESSSSSHGGGSSTHTSSSGSSHGGGGRHF